MEVRYFDDNNVTIMTDYINLPYLLHLTWLHINTEEVLQEFQKKSAANFSENTLFSTAFCHREKSIENKSYFLRPFLDTKNKIIYGSFFAAENKFFYFWLKKSTKIIFYYFLWFFATKNNNVLPKNGITN
jgi:hypothetical protein